MLSRVVLDVPEGKSGDWAVDRITVTESHAAFSRMRMIVSGEHPYDAGVYTRLTRCGTVVMSDTHGELRDHREAIRRAAGDVLIMGLGLGLVIHAIADREEVKSITVVEKSADVIKLVAPHYEARLGERLKVVNDDALTWRPPRGARYGMVWHDIWEAICSDNLPEMKMLTRRYARRTKWQGCWARERIR